MKQKNVGYCIDIQRFNKQETRNIVPERPWTCSLRWRGIAWGWSRTCETPRGTRTTCPACTCSARRCWWAACLVPTPVYRLNNQHRTTTHTIWEKIKPSRFENKSRPTVLNFLWTFNLISSIMGRDYESLTNIFHKVIHKSI